VSLLSRFWILLIAISSTQSGAQVFRYPTPPSKVVSVLEAPMVRAPVDTLTSTRVDTISGVERITRILTIGGAPEPAPPVAPPTGSESSFKTITEGQIGLRDGKPAIGVNLVEFYASPDIKGWNWQIPLILISSNTVDGGSVDANRVAADLLEAFAGALNGSVSAHKEWRGPTADGKPSITGIYLDFGGIGKINPVSGTTGAADTYYASVGPHLRADFRLTTKSKRDASDYTGVLHARIAVTGNYILNRPVSFDSLFGKDKLKSVGAFEFSLGWFPVNEASINLVTLTAGMGDLPGQFKHKVSTGLSLFPKR
jgi:hypothetical protein